MPAPEQPFFRHEPLDTSDESIRLLRLLPGSDDSEIECELFNATFPIKQQYSALSYEWGDDDTLRSISVNSTPFLVRPNLHEFLSQIRAQLKAELPLLLWVDAVCIDQNHLEERNHQVKMMKQIYSKAFETLAWTGKGSDNLTEMFKILNSEIDRHNEIDPKSDPWLPQMLQDDLRNAISPTIADKTLLPWAERPYWKRIWIIQEIVLATRHRIFAGSDHLKDGVLMLLDSLITWSDPDDVLRLSPMAAVLSTWIHSQEDPDENNVFELLQRFGPDTRCSDPHDKLYGLLGIAKNANLFDVDYNKPLAHLWLEVAASSPVVTWTGIETLRGLLIDLELIDPWSSSHEAAYMARADDIHCLLRAKNWNFPGFRKWDVSKERLGRIIKVQVDTTVTIKTTFTTNGQAFELDSMRPEIRDWWHLRMDETNLCLLLSGARDNLQLEVVAFAVHQKQGIERDSELALAALTRHSNIFEQYSQQSQLVKVDWDGTNFASVSVPLEFMLSLVAAEPRWYDVEPGKNEPIRLKQIWPKQGSGYGWNWSKKKQRKG